MIHASGCSRERAGIGGKGAFSSACAVAALVAAFSAFSQELEPYLGTPPVAESAAAVSIAAKRETSFKFGCALPAMDPQNRASVEEFYYLIHQASEGVPPPAAADVASCDPGSASFLYDAATLLRVDYFRAMAGLPCVGLNEEWSSKCREAAVMMLANCALNHTPPDTWKCFTDEGYEAASHSNLYIGVFGPAAINGYIQDPGSANTFVGHRRWVLCPSVVQIGVGSVLASGGSCQWSTSNSLWVIGHNYFAEPRDEPVAWPPAGYVPKNIVYPRWSLSRKGADFGNASVVMTCDGLAVPLKIVAADDRGYGDSTIVWEPTLPAASAGRDSNNLWVYVSGIGGDCRAEYSYNVVQFGLGKDPYGSSVSKAANPAELAWVYPAQGSNTADTQVALFGRNIGVKGVRVVFGEQEAAVLETCANALHVSAPPSDAGTVDVSVMLPSGAATKLPAAFSYDVGEGEGEGESEGESEGEGEDKPTSGCTGSTICQSASEPPSGGDLAMFVLIWVASILTQYTRAVQMR